MIGTNRIWAIVLTVLLLAVPAADRGSATGIKRAAVSCNDDSAFCTAATLSMLYSAGAEIATRACASADATCETTKGKALAAAADRYRTYLAGLTARHADPRFEGAVKSAADTTAAQVTAFVDRALPVANGPCRLTADACVIGRVYLLADLDQAARNHPRCGDGEGARDCLSQKRATIARIDSASRVWATRLLATHGWPTAERWGRTTEDSFFLLIQHADADPVLQRRALAALKKAGGRGSAEIHMAYLEDRVRVHARQAQLYGTQGRCRASGEGGPVWRPDPITEPERVDERRRAAGMEPLADYAKTAAAACEQF